MVFEKRPTTDNATDKTHQSDATFEIAMVGQMIQGK